MSVLSLRPIKENKTYLQVVNSIVSQIFEGRIPYDHTLNTEQELTQTLNISRPTLREALRVMEFLGIISVKRGNGVHINSPEDLSGYSSLLYLMMFDRISDAELFELREIMQTSMARNAALYRSEEDVEELQQLLQDAEKLLSLPEINMYEFASIDKKFHDKIIECSRNRICMRLMQTLSEALREQLETTTTSLKGHMMVLQEHRQIYQCIKLRDAEGAYDAMRDHLKGAGRIFAVDKTRNYLSERF